MDRPSLPIMDSPAQLSQAASTFSQALSSNDGPHNEHDLFAALVDEVEDLRITSLDMWNKYNNKNVPEPVNNDSCAQLYVDILNEKKNLINNLSQVVSSSSPVGNLKGKLDAYREFSLVLKQRFNEGIAIEQQLQEEIKALTARNEELDKRIQTFSNILQNPEEEPAASQKLIDQLKETRDDMNTVLRSLYPQEIVTEMTNAMLAIWEAYWENKDNEEAQYVEVSKECCRNKALLCLLQANVIVRHPKNPLMLRLLSDD